MMGPEPMTSTFLIRGSLGIVDYSFRGQHTADELVKQKFGVLGAAVGLGVELHGEAVPFQVVDASQVRRWR